MGEKASVPAGRIFESHLADYSARVHRAVRADGVWFERSSYRHGYHHCWSRWRRLSAAPSYPGMDTGRNARLPKDGTWSSEVGVGA